MELQRPLAAPVVALRLRAALCLQPLSYQAVFTLVTHVKVFDVVRVDVRNGLCCF